MPGPRTRRPKTGRWDPLTVGVDVGGTKVLAGVVDASGRVLGRATRLTPGHSAPAVEDAIVALVTQLGADHPVAAVGIGAAGFVDATRSVVTFSPHLAWRDEPLRDAVRQRLKLPVVVDNDANVTALAEAQFGSAVGYRQVLCVTMGTGIGGALVLDGKVHRGTNGMAGEFGHIQVVPGGEPCECGNTGCWEQYASGNALVRSARRRIKAADPAAARLADSVAGDVDRLDGPMITAAAVGGDPLSVELLREVGEWLGVGLAGMVAAFDPGCVVVGGGVSAAGDLLLAPARAAFGRTLVGRGFRPEPPLLAAALGPDAGFIGAAAMARSAARRSRRRRRRARPPIRLRAPAATRPRDRRRIEG